MPTQSNKYAASVTRALKSRCAQTQEVKEVLAGQGFLENRPYYISKPNL